MPLKYRVFRVSHHLYFSEVTGLAMATSYVALSTRPVQLGCWVHNNLTQQVKQARKAYLPIHILGVISLV